MEGSENHLVSLPYFGLVVKATAAISGKGEVVNKVFE